MKYLYFTILLAFFSYRSSVAQNTLFDNSHVSDVYIEIPADTLDWIMANVLSDHYCKALFIYDYGVHRDTLQDVGFRLRGNTSRFSQKKSFKISFNEYVAGRRYQEVKKINLNGQHNDPTLIREKLFYDTWKNAGLAERRTSFVRLFINNSYYGLYTNLEEFDKDWLMRVYGENSGNLYKCTYPADLVYLGEDQQTYKNIMSGSSTGGRAYDLQTNETLDDYSDLVDLISALNQPADATFAIMIAGKLDVDNLLKAFALDVATGNWDDYMYNKNNYFLYHRTDNGKFEFISYDPDNTFGVDWVNHDWATRDCLNWYSQSGSRPLVVKILSVPEFNTRYQYYLEIFVRDIFNPDIIFPHIDSLKALITEAAIADTYRTLDWGYTVDDFDNGYIQQIDGHTPYGIKQFISLRNANTLLQLPSVSVAELAVNEPTVQLYPNPASETITVYATQSIYDRQVFIGDILGRPVKSSVFPENQAFHEISISDLKPGLYNLYLKEDGRLVSKRFIKR